jgi:hypothetical protein
MLGSADEVFAGFHLELHFQSVLAACLYQASIMAVNNN